MGRGFERGRVWQTRARSDSLGPQGLAIPGSSRSGERTTMWSEDRVAGRGIREPSRGHPRGARRGRGAGPRPAASTRPPARRPLRAVQDGPPELLAPRPHDRRQARPGEGPAGPPRTSGCTTGNRTRPTSRSTPSRRDRVQGARRRRRRDRDRLRRHALQQGPRRQPQALRVRQGDGPRLPLGRPGPGQPSTASTSSSRSTASPSASTTTAPATATPRSTRSPPRSRTTARRSAAASTPATSSAPARTPSAPSRSSASGSTASISRTSRTRPSSPSSARATSAPPTCSRPSPRSSYDYCLALEYEENPEDPLAEIRECLTAAKKAAATLPGT